MRMRFLPLMLLLASCAPAPPKPPVVPEGWQKLELADYGISLAMPKPIARAVMPHVDAGERSETHRAAMRDALFLCTAVELKDPEGGDEAMSRTFDKGQARTLSGGEYEDLGSTETEVGGRYAIRHSYRTKEREFTTLVAVKGSVAADLSFSVPLGQKANKEREAFLGSLRFTR